MNKIALPKRIYRSTTATISTILFPAPSEGTIN
jgi:hypothetical protein